MGLLAHDNTDISISVLELLNDLVDAEVLSETEDVSLCSKLRFIRPTVAISILIFSVYCVAVHVFT
jgi:hypothetical protein